MKYLHHWNIRTAVIGIVVLFIAAGMLAGCSGRSDGTSAIQKAGVLKAAVVDYQNDYMKRTKNHYSGTEAELVEKIANTFGVQQAFIEAKDIEDAVSKVSNGETDLAIAMIPEHTYLDKSLISSVPYKEERLYVITRKDDCSDSPQSFNDRTLGASPVLSEILERVAYTVDDINIEFCKDSQKAISALVKNQTIDGYLCEYQEGIAILESALKEAGILGNKPAIQMQNLQNAEPERFVIVTQIGNGHLIRDINAIIHESEKYSNR